MSAEHEHWCVTCDCGALAGPGQAGAEGERERSPTAPLEGLIRHLSDVADPRRSSELRSVKVELTSTGSMYRVTCMRAHGAPLTTIDRDLHTALRLALQELSP